MAGKNFVEIILSATDKTGSGIKGAKDNLGGLQSQLKMVGAAFLAMGSAAVAGFAYAAKEQINYADEIGKMAQKAGVSTETLSTMAYVAKQSGVEIEGLQTGFKKLTVNMADTAKGTGTAKQYFDLLKISVTNQNGTLKSSSQVMKEVADKFAGLQDGAEKSSIAVALFGKAGEDLIPMLNQGSSGINQMQQRAKDLGLEIGSKFAKNAEVFNDSLDDLKQTGMGVINSAIQELLPYLKQFAEWFASQGPGIITWFKGFIRDIESCSDEFNSLLNIGKSVGVILWTAFQLVGDKLARIGTIVFNLVQGEWKEAYKTMAGESDAQMDIYKEAGKKLENIWTARAETHKKILKRETDDSKKAVTLQTNSLWDALNQQSANQKKWDAQTGQEKLETTKATLGQVQGLMSAHNLTLFRLGQAASISLATIDGYQAVTKAYATFPFPFSAIVAGIVGAAVAVNVANIAATPPPAFASGGIVPGNDFSGDRVHALVNSGELILNKAQQDSVANQMNSGDVSINMTLGDRTFAKQFKRMSKQGRLEWAI